MGSHVFSAGAELPHLLEPLLQTQGPQGGFSSPWIHLAVSFRAQLLGCTGRAKLSESHSPHRAEPALVGL